MKSNASTLINVRRLSVDFKAGDEIANAVKGVSFTINKGETVALVGESGSGKTVSAQSILKLLPYPTASHPSGEIFFHGKDLLGLNESEMRTIRGRRISMIFQEPMTSLNPVFTVGEQIAESVRLHEGASPQAAWSRAVEMLREVEIPEAEARAKAYPHQLSGGMRQRVMIAMALACRPKVLIADEPTTALDTTVQSQIFDLLQNLQEETGTAIILITHDMGAIAELADTVAVMYAGRVVEQGAVETVLRAPEHPYTKGLITCVPHLLADPPPEREPLEEIPGVVPALTDLGAGCAFAPRCKQVEARCREAIPKLQSSETGHLSACWVVHAETAP